MNSRTLTIMVMSIVILVTVVSCGNIKAVKSADNSSDVVTGPLFLTEGI